MAARLDIRWLEALVAVAEAGSFRAGAKDLGYTQSAISHQIAALERHLGGEAFVRPGGRGRVRLTPLGELAHQHAQRLLAAARALDADVLASRAGERGTMRIALTQGVGFVLADPLTRLRRDRPGVQVSLVGSGAPEVLAQ